MTYHYHQPTCPHCGEVHIQRGCNLDNCTTAIVSLEPFTSSDGCVAKKELCPGVVPLVRADSVYYVDYGDRPLRDRLARPSPPLSLIKYLLK